MNGLSISLTRERKGRRALGMTPLVDVIFLLVVFYLLVSQFTQLRTLPVTVSDGTNGSPAREAWTVSVTGPDEIFFNGKPTSLERVESELRLKNPGEDTTLVILIAADVPLQTAVGLLDAAAHAGIAAVSLRAWRKGP